MKQSMKKKKQSMKKNKNKNKATMQCLSRQWYLLKVKVVKIRLYLDFWIINSFLSDFDLFCFKINLSIDKFLDFISVV